MGNYTIVRETLTVTVDNKTQTFNFTDDVNDEFGAVIWDFDDDPAVGTGRLEEYIDTMLTVSEITDFTPYQPIIDEFYTRTTTVASAKQIDLDTVTITYSAGNESTITVQEAIDENIAYSVLDLQLAKDEKTELVRTDVAELTNELFNSVDILAQVKTRTMLSYNWSSLNGKEILTPAEEDDLVLYNEILDYLNDLDNDIASNNENIRLLSSTQEVMDYVIVLTPIPPGLQDEKREALKRIKLSSV